MVAPGLKQSWVMSSAIVNVLGQGLVLSFPTSLLPALQDPNSTLKVDLDTASWLASANFQASIIGFIMSSFTMDMCGRRRAFIMGLLPSVVGWFLIYFTPNISTLLIGRMLTGITGGATSTLGAIVVGEYSSPQFRGLFLSLKTAGTCMGIMIGHILANYCDYRIFGIIAFLIQAISLGITYTWPESPSWYLSKNNFDECKKSFYWLRGKCSESKTELDEMFRAQKERMERFREKSLLKKTQDFLKKFTRADFLKPTAVIFTTCLLVETSGRHVFPAFFVEIIGSISGKKSKSFAYTLYLDTIVTGSALCSTFLVKIMKRRALLFPCGLVSLLALSLLSIYIFLADNHILLENNTWTPISLFAMYLIFVNLGCSPIHIVLLGEIFPLAHKSAGSIVSGFIAWFISSIVIQVTPYMLTNINVCGFFAVMVIGMGSALLVLFVILPETKDKTLQEIEDYFMNDNYLNYKRMQELHGTIKTI